MLWLVSRGMLVIWIDGGEGGYASWDHFLLRFTVVLNGVGGTFVVNMVGICSVVPMAFI